MSVCVGECVSEEEKCARTVLPPAGRASGPTRDNQRPRAPKGGMEVYRESVCTVAVIYCNFKFNSTPHDIKHV